MWARTLFVIVSIGWSTLAADENDVCENTLRPTLLAALAVSYLELFTSLIGLTRSNPIQVLLFSTVRAGVEVLVAPLLPCGCWQHLLTATCWSAGDVIRFGCFALDSLAPQALGSLVKATRYTIGPLLFPLGAGTSSRIQKYSRFSTQSADVVLTSLYHRRRNANGDSCCQWETRNVCRSCSLACWILPSHEATAKATAKVLCISSRKGGIGRATSIQFYRESYDSTTTEYIIIITNSPKRYLSN